MRKGGLGTLVYSCRMFEDNNLLSLGSARRMEAADGKDTNRKDEL